MKEWQDVSAYARGDRGKIDPRVWELEAGLARLLVHRLQGIEDEWFVTCHAVGIESMSTETRDIETAKKRAIEIVEGRLEQTLRSLREATGKTEPKAHTRGARPE